jgi:hypothetical protein
LTNNKNKNACLYRNKIDSNSSCITKHDLSSKLRENKVKEMKNGKDFLEILMKQEHQGNMKTSTHDFDFPDNYSNNLFPVKTEKTEYELTSIETARHSSSLFKTNKEIVNRVLLRNN